MPFFLEYLKQMDTLCEIQKEGEEERQKFNNVSIPFDSLLEVMQRPATIAHIDRNSIA